MVSLASLIIPHNLQNDEQIGPQNTDHIISFLDTGQEIPFVKTWAPRILDIHNPGGDILSTFVSDVPSAIEPMATHKVFHFNKYCHHTHKSNSIKGPGDPTNKRMGILHIATCTNKNKNLSSWGMEAAV